MEEFEEFRESVFQYADQFGLTDWNIEVAQNPLPDTDEQTRARAWMNWTQRSARVTWNSAYREKSDCVSGQTPRQVAAHEVIHILLNTLVSTAIDQKDFDAHCLNAEEHAVINRVMRAIKA